MIDNITLGSKATGAGTRIATLLIQTGQIARAFRIDGALGSTVGRGSNKVGQAATAGATIDLATLRIGSTRRRYTWHSWLYWFLLLWRHGQATYEGISGIARLARAQWTMIAYMTLGIQSTRSWAGIRTFLLDTRLIRRTFRADDTLGTTCWRSTNKFGQARADRLTLTLATLSIGATG